MKIEKDHAGNRLLVPHYNTGSGNNAGSYTPVCSKSPTVPSEAVCDPNGPFRGCAKHQEFKAGRTCTNPLEYEGQFWCTQVHCCVPAPTPGPATTGGCNWQCYRNRYSDLRNQYEEHNLAGLEARYNSWGPTQGRDCTCLTKCPNGQS